MVRQHENGQVIFKKTTAQKKNVYKEKLFGCRVYYI